MGIRGWAGGCVGCCVGGWMVQARLRSPTYTAPAGRARWRQNFCFDFNNGRLRDFVPRTVALITKNNAVVTRLLERDKRDRTTKCKKKHCAHLVQKLCASAVQALGSSRVMRVEVQFCGNDFE